MCALGTIARLGAGCGRTQSGVGLTLCAFGTGCDAGLGCVNAACSPWAICLARVDGTAGVTSLRGRS